MAELRYGGFWRRLGAWLIDKVILWLIIMLTILVISAISSAVGGVVQTLLGVFLIVLVLVIALGYGVYFLSTRGATPGKEVLGLVVVDKYNKYPLKLSKALVREMLGRLLIDGLTLNLGNLIIIFDSKKQALHDKVADTYVVHKDSLIAQQVASVPIKQTVVKAPSTITVAEKPTATPVKKLRKKSTQKKT